MSNLFYDNKFDRDFKRTARLAVFGWFVTLLITLGFAGVVVWAIIKTVNHFFG